MNNHQIPKPISNSGRFVPFVTYGDTGSVATPPDAFTSSSSPQSIPNLNRPEIIVSRIEIVIQDLLNEISLAASPFDFWDNKDDAIYDNL